MILDEAFEVHDTLNPKLWDSDNKLLPDVRAKLFGVIEEFKKQIDIDMHFIDAIIVGSNASYNYTAHSDIDLHAIVNFATMDASEKILTILTNQLKSSFNSKYDIKIRGLEVELYIEDASTSAVSNGIYSLFNDKWIKFPKKLTDIPKVDVSNTIEKWKQKINDAIESKNSDYIVSIINELYLIRKNSIATSGEYGRGNQLFKEIRNLGLIDKLKDAFYENRSKDLSLEHLNASETVKNALCEASRIQLINKSKASPDGQKRFKNRLKAKLSSSVKSYNNIDMNKLFKDNIFTIDIEVQGETDTYIVRISFGGFLDILHDQLRNNPDAKIDLKMVTRALTTGFNRNDVYIHCSCPDFKYVYDYYATKNNITSGDAQNIASNEKNPDDKKGAGCKHVLMVLSNTSWILKCASSVYNYVNYMERNYKKLYADIIYPAIYQKKYEEPVQLTIDDTDDTTMKSDKDTIDASNAYAADKGKFKPGNQSGVQFASSNNNNNQPSLFDDENSEEENS